MSGFPGQRKTQTTGDCPLPTASTEKVPHLWHFFWCQAPSTFSSDAEDSLCCLRSQFPWASCSPLPGTQTPLAPLGPECALHLGQWMTTVQLLDCEAALPSPQSSWKKHLMLLMPEENVKWYIHWVNTSEAHLQPYCNRVVLAFLYITARLSSCIYIYIYTYTYVCI